MKRNRFFHLRGYGHRRTISKIAILAFAVIFAGHAAGQDTTARGSLNPLSAGKPGSSVKIQIFYDLQCPACARFHATLNNVESKFGDKVFITFRHFPLDLTSHDKSFLAARVVEAAHLQGKGWKMLRLIMSNQRKWTASKRVKLTFMKYARVLRLNMSRFNEDLDGAEVSHRIVRDIELARLLKLNSVPTILVNGKGVDFSAAHDLEKIVHDLVK